MKDEINRLLKRNKKTRTLGDRTPGDSFDVGMLESLIRKITNESFRKGHEEEMNKYNPKPEPKKYKRIEREFDDESQHDEIVAALNFASKEDMLATIEDYRKKRSEIAAKGGAGAPKYYSVEPKYIEMALTAFDHGETKAQVAAKWGKSVDTINRWMKYDESFAEAMQIGMTRSEAVWCRDGQKISRGQMKGNVGVFSFIMRNAFNYKDRITDALDAIDDKEKTMENLKKIEQDLLAKSKKET